MPGEVIWAVMPAYNEREAIAGVARAWHDRVMAAGAPGSALLVVDDGSTDGTADELAALARELPGLRVLTKENGGHGAAVLAGYREALASGADWVFQTDSDGQTDPAEFPAFFEARDGVDAVFGVRASRGDGAARAFVERVLCMVVRLSFGVAVPDANAPFRLMSAPALAELMACVPPAYELPNAALTALFAASGRPVAWREVSFAARQAGTNKLDVRGIVRAGARAVTTLRAIARTWRSATA